MVQGELRVHLFGGLSIQRSNQPDSVSITRFPTQKVAALLAILSLAPGRRFTREVLADRLWTDADVEDGRRSLRVALAALRRILEPPGIAPGTVLIADRETIALRFESVSTDVADFEAAVRRGDSDRARELYDAGPLLPALYDDWILDTRARLDETYAALPKARSSAATIAVAEAPLPLLAAVPKRDLFEHLPSYLTRFIGRDTEIEKLTALWDDDTNRLITITGSGGIGKTRLVTQAVSLTPRSRVLRFVPLYDARDGEGVQKAMVAALQLEPAQSGESNIVPALEALGRTRLILDNVEQLVAAGIGDTVARWLSACPMLQIVVTSRQRLNLPGERELLLNALIAPTLPATPERLLDFDAVRLFVDRAQIARPDIQITPRSAETVAHLCECLGGLPLALELTAAWAGVLTFSQMLSRVEAQLLDETGPPTAAKRAARPARHQTLRIALETSLELLTPTLRRAFADLAVFRGGFTAEAAQAVLGGESGAVETLSRLRERSLLITESSDEEDVLRFRMLPDIYACARERFDADAVRAAEMSEAHCDYFLSLSEMPRTKEKALDADDENFRSALSVAEARFHDDADLRLCVALAPFWTVRGHTRYGNERLEQVLVRRANADPAKVAAAYRCAGLSAYLLCDYPRARIHHEKALELSRQQQDETGIGRALHSLARVALDAETDVSRAIELIELALECFRHVQAPDLEAEALMSRAVAEHYTGGYEEALQFLEESLALSQASGNIHLQAKAHHLCGINLRNLSRLDEAVEHYETALTILRACGDVREIAYTLTDLGTAAYEQSEFGTAMQRYGEAVAVLRNQGDLWAVSIGLSNMGRVSSEIGEFARAATFLTESLHLRVQLGAKYRILQAIDAVIHLLVYRATPQGKAPRRLDAQAAVRLRAADTALRQKLGLPEAMKDAGLLPKWEALHTDLGTVLCACREAEGAAMTFEEAVSTTRDLLAKIR